MTGKEREKCAVLVTGGAGFLGQHLIGLLQTRADHVTEIRVLDVVPYENKLDYVQTKPIKTFVGSITDESILKEACDGVVSVIHLAAIPDSRMFPDEKRINEVNIQGTLLTLLTALGTIGVRRFIYCSSMSVSIGNNDVTENIKESDPIPSTRIFEPYASSKLAGERIVLAANGPTFRTVCIRPLVMWGELDTIFIGLSQKMAKDTFGYTPVIDTGKVLQHNSYVGNTAWGFVCAETKLYLEMKGVRINKQIDQNQADQSKQELCSVLRRRSQKMREHENEDASMCDFTGTNKQDEESSANIYFIADDTPMENPFKFQEPFLKATGYALTNFSCPIFIIAIFFGIIYACVFILRCFGLKSNYPVAFSCLQYYKRTYSFDDTKARSELGYKPLYTPKQAFERSLKYYSKNRYK
ncbi:hypothetical protein ACF0H5_017358 [Mactra antiquata]